MLDKRQIWTEQHININMNRKTWIIIQNLCTRWNNKELLKVRVLPVSTHGHFMTKHFNFVFTLGFDRQIFVFNSYFLWNHPRSSPNATKFTNLLKHSSLKPINLIKACLQIRIRNNIINPFCVTISQLNMADFLLRRQYCLVHCSCCLGIFVLMAFRHIVKQNSSVSVWRTNT